MNESKNERNPATLYVVGTPIGNLEDLTPRAARVLRAVALVAAEDTRVARRLLNHLGARPRVISFNEHNWRGRLEPVLQALETGDVALVSDAGMPGVSDPGRELVAAAAANGFRVEATPGPSAVTTALSVSGLPADAFRFLGFLPRSRRQRRERLAEAVGSPDTIVIFEAPHRLRTALEDIAGIFADRPISICRELTKLHEEVYRGTASAALEHFVAPRGEFVLVLAGAPKQPESPDATGEGEEPTASTNEGETSHETSRKRSEEVRSFLAERRRAGVRPRVAAAEAAASFGISKNRAYQLWLDTRGDG